MHLNLSTTSTSHAAAQDGSLPAAGPSLGPPPPWVRAVMSTLAADFTRAAEYEDRQGFGNAQGDQRFSEFLHDLLCRARQATAHDPSTYRAVAALAVESQQYPSMRVPERALLLVRTK